MLEPVNKLHRPIEDLIKHLQKLPPGTTYEETNGVGYGGQTQKPDGTWLGTSYHIELDICEGIVIPTQEEKI